ncbi:response regulator [Halonotius terrestris]|uniref:Response regulator n=1 Tax=Halonotius terrestris TaxID=2487750 RepID=A0A8J8PD80_9EURY|nr:response regulator [Halonotius terrestris]TQQ82883.1 response regulator [Halonotius terrestris]
MTDDEKTVLIVEDEEALAQSYELHLEDDYETDIATNGGQALAKLGPDIDLVLLDRRMPGMAGDEVLKRIDEWELDFQIIVVSAIDPDVDIIDLPFDGYLTKSVSKDDLLDAVDRAFLKKRYEDLIVEYNSAAETYDVLRNEYSQAELDAKDEFAELETRLEELEAEIHDIIDELDDSTISNIFD